MKSRKEMRARLNKPNPTVPIADGNTCSVSPEPSYQRKMDIDWEMRKALSQRLGELEYERMLSRIQAQDLDERVRFEANHHEGVMERLQKTLNENHALLDAIAPFAEIGELIQRGQKITVLKIHPKESKHFRKACDAWTAAGKGGKA